jgi:hypothetical protein
MLIIYHKIIINGLRLHHRVNIKDPRIWLRLLFKPWRPDWCNRIELLVSNKRDGHWLNRLFLLPFSPTLLRAFFIPKFIQKNWFTLNFLGDVL